MCSLIKIKSSLIFDQIFAVYCYWYYNLIIKLTKFLASYNLNKKKKKKFNYKIFQWYIVAKSQILNNKIQFQGLIIETTNTKASYLSFLCSWAKRFFELFDMDSWNWVKQTQCDRMPFEIELKFSNDLCIHVKLLGVINLMRYLKLIWKYFLWRRRIIFSWVLNRVCYRVQSILLYKLFIW